MSKVGRPTKSAEEKLVAKITISLNESDSNILYKLASIAGEKPTTFLAALIRPLLHSKLRGI